MSVLGRPPWRQLLTVLLVVAAAVAVVRLAKPTDQTADDPPGAGQWSSDASRPAARGADPAQVAAYFATLDQAHRQQLVQDFPAVVSGLGGAPLDLRYAASARIIAGLPAYSDFVGLQVLSFDPRTDGQGAFVFGDLSTAEEVAYVVTGDDTQIAHPEDAIKKITWAQNVYRLAARTQPHVAVVFWAGYTSPVGMSIEALRSGAAVVAAGRLVGFVDGVRAATRSTAPPTLICHSYGTLVCAKSVAAGLPPIGALVLLGSPGLDVDSAAQLGTNAPVYSAIAPTDWIRKVPHARILGVGHGTTPADPAFGAHALPTGGVTSHDGYLDDGTRTLTAVAAIVAGAAS